MRPIKFWVLPALFFAAAVPSIMLSRTQKTEDKTSGPQRNAPRASADSYHSHAQRDGISVGAEIRANDWQLNREQSLYRIHDKEEGGLPREQRLSTGT
jgi:hypothetical protein